MSQTSVIFFGLLVGFIVFVTLRGQLPGYLAVLGLGNQAVPGTVTAGIDRALGSGATRVPITI